MLDSVDVGAQRLDSYLPSIGAAPLDELRTLAAPLAGARILHVNATPYGGGVAELLRSEIPLLNDLGLVARWKLITDHEEFFATTKAIHNGLQGAPKTITDEQWQAYLRTSQDTARQLDEHYDLVVIHDPQPLALAADARDVADRWVWRCHVDTSEPNPEVWARLQPLMEPYDAAVFTLGGFVPPDFPVRQVEIVPPAIDPQSPKKPKAIARSFNAIAWPAFGILVATGIWNVTAVDIVWSSAYGTTLIVKLALVGTMLG